MQSNNTQPINNAQLGRTIRELRRARKLSQTEVCSELGISKNYLSQLENGRKGASVPRLNDFAKFFGIPTAFITFLATDVSDCDDDDDRDQLFCQIREMIMLSVRAETDLAEKS